MSYISVQTSLARKRETVQYNFADLIQARQNVAAPMHRVTAREKVVNRAATNLPHPLFVTGLWMVPWLWFMVFISASTGLRQVVLGRPRFRFLSGIQWIAALVMKL